MSNQKITFDDKVGIKPKTVRINQVWDDDMNQIKTVVNDNDDKALYKGANVLDETTTIQVTPTFSLNFNDGALTSLVVGDQLIQLSGNIKVLPSGVTPEVGKAIGWTNVDGTIGSVDVGGSGGLVPAVDLGTASAADENSNTEAIAAIVSAYNALPVGQRTLTESKDGVFEITLEEGGGGD